MAPSGVASASSNAPLLSAAGGTRAEPTPRYRRRAPSSIRNACRTTHAGFALTRARFNLSFASATALWPDQAARSSWTRASIDAASVGSHACAADETSSNASAMRMRWSVSDATAAVEFRATRQAPAGAREPALVRQRLDANACHSTAEHSQFARRGPGDVDDAAIGERAAIVDAHDHRPSVVQVCNADPGAERQIAVSGGERLGIETLAARGPTPREGLAVIRPDSVL